MSDTLDSITVLHVDSNSDAADLVATSLEREDDRLDVITATGASDGLDRLNDRDVDCIVSDYDMPRTDGLAFLDAVRADHEDLPFILFTGEGSETVASEAISAGVSGYLQRNAGGEQYELLANKIVNSVEQYRAERTADRTRRQLRELTENTNDVLWLFTHDWDELLFVNSSYRDIYGRSVEAFREHPRDFLNAVHPDDREPVTRAMERLSKGQSVDFECRVNEAENYRRWVWVRGDPILDDCGDVVRVVGCSRDITDRKQHSRRLEELHEATRRLIRADSKQEVAEITVETTREFLDMQMTGCWLYDETADVLRPVESTDEADTTVGELPTYHGGESLSWEAFATGESKVFDDVSTQSGRHATETKIRGEIIVPLGEYGVLNSGSTEPGAFDEIDVSLVQLLAANAETVLERIEREADLRDERMFVRQALNTLDDIFYVVGLNGELLRWNDSLAEVTGYTDAEIGDMRAVEFFPGDESDRVAEAIAETLETGQAIVEAELITKDGERIPSEFAGSRLIGPDGEVIGLVGIGRDITERRERERRLERQNERLDEFASLVSHDLRNPLNVAQGRTTLAQEECDSEHLNAVARSHDRIAALIDDLLTLARQRESATDIGTVDLADAVERGWQNVDTANATLVTDSHRVIRADETRVQQLLENLLRNAVEHGGENVVVTVRDLDGGFYVADDGPGIPEENRTRAFEGGYSTNHGGTGFGLSIVERIATAHDWEVSITRGTEGGARVEITGVEFA